MSDPINVIEIRKATNGYVISAWCARRYIEDHLPRGYATYVVESDDPAAVGKAVERAIADHAITTDVVIPAARELP